MDQRALLKRGHALAGLLRYDTRFSYYGRAVGITSARDGDVEDLVALAKVQGNSNCGAVPDGESEVYASPLRSNGFVPLVYKRWEGAQTCLEAARQVVSHMPLPSDVSLHLVSPETRTEVMQSAADMALACGVLPTAGASMRGVLQPSVTFLAIDDKGQAVSIAAASAFAHSENDTLSGQAWWGMLATDLSYRGRSLALILGAHATLEMNRRFGFRSFMTGVEPGNAASETVCAKMGLQPKRRPLLDALIPRRCAAAG